MADRLLFSIVGVLAGLGVPFTWFLWRAFLVRRPWWMSFLKTELNHHYEVYVCLGTFAVMICAFIGYWLGKKNDDLREISKTVEESNFSLNHLAITDGLTGLFNSRYMHDRLDLEIQTAFRSPITCLLIDIDFFKRINDKYGHPTGDGVLIALSKILKSSVRRMDAVGRLGGEEFIVLMQGAPQERALEVAERIRQTVGNETFSLEGKEIHITVSIGVVTYPAPGLQYRAGLLKAVDDALYAAKRSGRNKVVVWTPATENKKAA